MKQPRAVLVIEDDPAISRLLELELRHHGMDVDVAADGLSGLTLAEQQRHDLILLDILLPAPDGDRLLAKVRRQGIMTPVIMLTVRKFALLSFLDGERAAGPATHEHP